MTSRPLLEIDREHKRVIVRTRRGPVVMSYRAAKRAARASRALLGPGRLQRTSNVASQRTSSGDASPTARYGVETCSYPLGASGSRT